ncbi:BAI1-associated protein, partial [Schistosoma japonicum]
IDRYVKQVFGLTQEVYDVLCAQACQAEPPIVVLNVSVIEAKNLEAKDLNGFSDPYCILGVIYGRYVGQNEKSMIQDSFMKTATSVSGQNDLESVQPSTLVPIQNASGKKALENNRVTFSRSSFRRLNQSFKKRTNQNDKLQTSHNESFKVSATSSSKSTVNKEGHVPVGLLKSTQVKEQTLNPVWNETFRLEIDDVSYDKLHLDIWDHDEETSVLEAVRSLNEIRGVKQLGRYFKQVSQSARKNQTGDMDDFLGCVTIDIKDIPSTGLDRWFKLEGRSNRSKVQGVIHLALSLSAQTDLSELEHDKTVAIQEHIQLFYLFSLHQLKQENSTGIPWNGNIVEEGEIILHQHAIQNGLTEIQEAMCQWIALTRLNCIRSLEQIILLHTFKHLISLWSDKMLTREELNHLSDSFKVFTEHSLTAICNYNLVYHNTQSEKLLDFNHLLECLCMLHNSRLFQFSSPFSNSLQKEFMTSFKEFVLMQYEKHKTTAMGKSDKSDLEHYEISQLIMLIKLMISDLEKCCEVYSPIIKKYFDLDPFINMYKLYANALHQDYVKMSILRNLTLPIINEELATKSSLSPNGKQSSVKTMELKSLFVLYLLLKTFENMFNIKTKSTEQKLIDFDWYSWFRPVISYWLQQCYIHLLSNIDVDIQNDQLSPTNEQLLHFLPNEIKPEKYFGLHSLSSLQIVNNLIRIMRTWMLIDWPDEQTKYEYTIEIVQTACETTLSYAKQLYEKLRLQGYCDEEGQFDISTSLSIGLNNLELVSKLIQWILSILKIQTPWPSNNKIAVSSNHATSNTVSSSVTAKYYNPENNDDANSNNNDNNVANDSSTVKIEFINDNEMKIPYQTLETLKTLQNKGYSELIRVLNRTIYRMNAKMRPEIRKNVFHLCWSLRSTPVDKAMHDLIVYLDSNIKTLKINVSSNLLQRCILSIWHECLEQYMEQTIKESEINSTNVGGPGAFLQLKPNFISGDNSLSVIPLSTHEIHEIISNLPTEVDRNQIFRAKYTLERLRKSLGILLEFFFKSSDEQISKENFETEEYHNVNYLIQLYNSSTPEVVEKYFIEKLNEQEISSSSSYGKLTVKIGYQRTSLYVDIQRATNLVPLDSNGLSDPFIIVELLPKHIFSETPKSLRTKIVKNTIDPVFDEHFEFSVPPEELLNPSACLAFIVMDHDLIMSNDFEGCVFIRTLLLFKSSNEKEGTSENSKLVFSNVRSQNRYANECKQLQICLPLIRPMSNKYGALDILGQRNDIYAQEIYKRWKTLEDSALN